MFNFIQELQQKNRAERKAIYEKIKWIDQGIDQDHPILRKIKDKEVRSVIMESFLKFKA